MASIIRNPVKYIAELFKPIQYDPRYAIADSAYSRQYNIFHFSIAPRITDTANYWNAWGGYFDNPETGEMQIFLNIFLSEVFDSASLIGTLNSFYIDYTNNKCYMHLPANPWQYYSDYAIVSTQETTTFSTAPKSETNPSDIYYGSTKADPRMDIPSLEVQLNDIISGVTVYDTFTIRIDNSDGKFDGLDIVSFFNTPMQISKSCENPTAIADFDRIRYGMIQDIQVESDKVVIDAADQLYAMSKDYCKKFTLAEYPNLDSGTVNENIPVGWGVLYGIEPIQVNKDTSSPAKWIDYIVLDPDYITAVSGVYDSDGNSLTHTFTALTGIVRVTSVDGSGEVIEAAYVNCTGKTACNIGEIITDALAQNENLSYVSGTWDITETDRYLAVAPDIGLYIDDGTTRDVIEAALKNDMAYLIEKHNGLLTLRRWGERYDTHTIPSWLITDTPKKNFADATKYYCSSAKVQYLRNETDDKYTKSYLNDSQERTLYTTYKKSYLATFETELINDADAEDLAGRIMDRFGDIRETVEIALGVDTFEINLLDNVLIEVATGEPERVFSPALSWIVKKVDPGQDTMTLEAYGEAFIMSFDGDVASIEGAQYIVEVV